ncbi:MAG TPA: hypothetical protein VMT18_10485 [Planctomycetota bacterium]|nr:hypothetical protein [Planctomycetota bacterium]
MAPRRTFAIQLQPDGASCGPTCLQAIYRHWGDDLPLSDLIAQIPQLDDGGVLAVQLGCHALRRGYRARIATLNLQLFDPSWFGPQPVDLRAKLVEQSAAKRKRKLHFATEAYLEFLDLGGEVVMRDLTAAWLAEELQAEVPLLTGLSATWLYHSSRETGVQPVDDDVRGVPQGHFVVLFGWDAERRRVLVADPERANPISREPIYDVDEERLIAAIHLGILTYDANTLRITPRYVTGAIAER